MLHIIRDGSWGQELNVTKAGMGRGYENSILVLHIDN
jgi:hypothetical protein